MVVVEQIIKLFLNNIIFLHLKLEIALAIPALNEEKYSQTIQKHEGWTI